MSKLSSTAPVLVAAATRCGLRSRKRAAGVSAVSLDTSSHVAVAKRAGHRKQVAHKNGRTKCPSHGAPSGVHRQVVHLGHLLVAWVDLALQQQARRSGRCFKALLKQ